MCSHVVHMQLSTPADRACAAKRAFESGDKVCTRGTCLYEPARIREDSWGRYDLRGYWKAAGSVQIRSALLRSG